MNWMHSFDQQAKSYDNYAPCRQALTKLRAFLDTIAPDSIVAPSVYGDIECMEAEWHYESKTTKIAVEVSMYPNGTGDIYVWDQSHPKSMMGDIDDPVYIELARKHLTRITEQAS